MVGKRLALDKDACTQILREGGFIPATTGLNAAELKKHLLENGDKIVGVHDPY